MTKNSKIAVVITAAGSSTRMGGGVKKEYLPLNNGTVLSNCAINFLNTFNSNYNFSHLIITHPKNGKKDAQNALSCDNEFIELIKTFPNLKIEYVTGGDSRQSSVFNALDFLSKCNSVPDYVLVHDGARPFVSEKIIKNVIEAACEFGASVPGIPPVDTQKEIDENGFIVRHLKRSSLMAVQTPQGFEFNKFYLAHKKAAEDGSTYTDDTEIWGNYVGQVKVVEGSVDNKKITYRGDL